MKIVGWICGIFSLAMLFVFLGKYAVSIGSIPLWIIIVGVVLLPVYDVYKTIKEENAAGGNHESNGK
jgi:hypothetical protein